MGKELTKKEVLDKLAFSRRFYNLVPEPTSQDDFLSVAGIIGVLMKYINDPEIDEAVLDLWKDIMAQETKEKD